MRTFVILVATAGGIGYVPVAPGTAGSLAALPLIPLLGALHARSAGAHAAVVAAVVVLAVWSAGRADRLFPGHDHGCIVIDEVSGMLMASLFVPATWTAAVLVFALFRLFDVLKPFPAGLIDRKWSGGLGVVGDDLVAGIYAGAAARLVLELL